MPTWIFISSSYSTHTVINQYMFTNPVLYRFFIRSLSNNISSTRTLLTDHNSSLEEALTLLEKSTELGPIETLIPIIERCRSTRNRGFSCRLYAYICKINVETYLSLSNHLIPMLVDCGNLAEARNVFDNLLRHDKLSGCDKVSRSENMSECENVLGYHKISKLDNVIKCNKLSICLAERVWTSLIQGYVDSAQYECAFVVFHTMQSNAVHPSIFTLQSLLKACARTKCCIYGLQLHLEVIYMENETNIYVAITLIDMYAKCGMLSEAKDVFDEMHVRNVVSWNALLSGYVTHGLFQEALECYNKIKLEAVVPDTCTFLCFLKACCQYGDIVKSREMHTSIIKGGLDGELYLASAMVDSYAKCHSLEEARDVFERSKERDVVLWNTMIVGYAELGFNEDVLQCVEKMERESISRSSITYVAALRACGSLRSIIFGRKLHSAVVKQGFWGDSHVGTALITMYAKCGLLVEAQRVFEGLNKVDIVAWTTLIASYVDHGYDEQALTHFASMEKSVGVDPDAVAYYYCLKACGNIGNIGGDIYWEVPKQRYPEVYLILGIAWLDM